MIIYPDTEKELFWEDYRPINNINLKELSIDNLEELQDNLQLALENTYIYHSELLSMAIDMDMKKVDLYLKMKYKKQEKERNK